MVIFFLEANFGGVQIPLELGLYFFTLVAYIKIILSNVPFNVKCFTF